MIHQKTILLSIFAVAAAIVLLAAAGCAPGEKSPEAELEEVTVLLDWTPNTNYSGLYVAKDRGFYAAEGLSVEIVQASGSVVQLVSTGQEEFGVSYQEEVTFARCEAVPVVSIAAILQHNTSGFASLKEKGITAPAGFEGHSYGGWGSPVEEATIRALMEHDQADFEKVDIVTTGEVDSLIVLQEAADLAWIYYGWTGVQAELAGMELNFIALREIDPDLDYYTPVLAAGEGLLAEKPELVRRFLRATARGYEAAIAEPGEAAAILLENAPELDEALVYASQEWLKDYYRAGAPRWGVQKRETWAGYTRWLYERGLIDELIDVDQAFTNDFLP